MDKIVAVSGSFDNLRSSQVRFLEEAARLGQVVVLLWSDAAAAANDGQAPKFPLAERRYVLESIRYVSSVQVVEAPFSPDELPLPVGIQASTWAVPAAADTPAKRTWCAAHKLDYRVITAQDLQGFRVPDGGQGFRVPDGGFAPDSQEPGKPIPGRKKVVVTGCYDWLHSGHVRFFEEVSSLGDLYVVVGNDENVRLLKGAGHPLFPEDERRYLVQSIRFVRQALVSSGMGWMDAEPEIAVLKPDIYAVNEDGDKPEKQTFCAEHGLTYAVLKRTPKAGLPRRQSTDLRGF